MSTIVAVDASAPDPGDEPPRKPRWCGRYVIAASAACTAIAVASAWPNTGEKIAILIAAFGLAWDLGDTD